MVVVVVVGVVVVGFWVDVVLSSVVGIVGRGMGCRMGGVTYSKSFIENFDDEEGFFEKG